MRAVVVAFALMLAACGPSAQHVARQSLAVTARSLRAVDAQLAPRYSAAAEYARDQSATWQEYDQRMQPWNAAESSERAMAHALIAAEVAVDALDERPREFFDIMPCLVLAADELVIALEAIDLGVELLRDALVVIRPYAGRCER